MATVSLDLPSDLIEASRRTPEEFVVDMRLAAAIYWYTRGEVSQSRAATIAGLSRIAFLDELARKNVDVVHVDIDELRRELERE